MLPAPWTYKFFLLYLKLADRFHIGFKVASAVDAQTPNLSIGSISTCHLCIYVPNTV